MQRWIFSESFSLLSARMKYKNSKPPVHCITDLRDDATKLHYPRFHNENDAFAWIAYWCHISSSSSLSLHEVQGRAFAHQTVSRLRKFSNRIRFEHIEPICFRKSEISPSRSSINQLSQSLKVFIILTFEILRDEFPLNSKNDFAFARTLA